MSHRHLTLLQLAEMSGLRKNDLRALLELLDRRGALEERERGAPDSFLDSIGKLGWFRRSRPAGSAQTTR